MEGENLGQRIFNGVKIKGALKTALLEILSESATFNIKGHLNLKFKFLQSIAFTTTQLYPSQGSLFHSKCSNMLKNLRKEIMSKYITALEVFEYR
jgi:hypothetical protein